MDMAEVQMAIYGKTVSLIGEMDNLMIAKEDVYKRQMLRNI